MAITHENIANPQTFDEQAFARVAAERGVVLPRVPMTFDYQSDVDLLSIRFAQPLSPDAIDDNDESGVIGIYHNGSLVGVEILDATGNLERADPR